MGEFGNKFRKAREKKQLSFGDVSKVLKIGARMLQAIEEENFDLLPGGVFNKGFIRSYASHLDLDPEESVSEYLATVRQAQIAAESALDSESAARPGGKPRVVGSPKSSKSQAPVEVEELPDLQLPRAEHVHPARKEYLDRPREGAPWSLIAAAVVVVLLAILVWIRHSRGPRASAPVHANPTVSQPSTPQVAPSSTVASQPQAPPSSDKKVPQQPLTTTPQPKAATAVPRSQPVPTPATGTTPTAPVLSLVIRASENSWVSVQADGRQVLEETMIAPARTAIGANKQIIVRVGNAAGVSFLFNGVEVSPQGNESEVKTLVFDPTGMKLPP